MKGAIDMQVTDIAGTEELCNFVTNTNKLRSYTKIIRPHASGHKLTTDCRGQEGIHSSTLLRSPAWPDHCGDTGRGPGPEGPWIRSHIVNPTIQRNPQLATDGSAALCLTFPTCRNA